MSATASCANEGCELEGIEYEIEDTSLPTYCGSCGVRLVVPGETAPADEIELNKSD